MASCLVAVKRQGKKETLTWTFAKQEGSETKRNKTKRNDVHGSHGNEQIASAGGSFLLLLLFTDRAGRPRPDGLSFSLVVFVIVTLLTNFGLPPKIMREKNRQNV
jgi:hypothetical protein